MITQEKEEFFSPEALVMRLKTDSRALGYPEGSAEPIIERVLSAVLAWLDNRNIVTRGDLERVVTSELDKYSPDLALIYRNKDQVI